MPPKLSGISDRVEADSDSFPEPIAEAARHSRNYNWERVEPKALAAETGPPVQDSNASDTVPRISRREKLMAVNVKGVFFCTKHAIPYMKAARCGSIINLSSIYGLVGAGDFPPYHASKGAVRLMSKNDALLYAADNIRVNSVHPGFIWTPMVENVAKQSDAGVTEFRKVIDMKHPLGHIGEPDDIAWGIVYLASQEAKFVTGAELVIDGGYTAQ